MTLGKWNERVVLSKVVLYSKSVTECVIETPTFPCKLPGNFQDVDSGDVGRWD